MAQYGLRWYNMATTGIMTSSVNTNVKATITYTLNNGSITIQGFTGWRTDNERTYSATALVTYQVLDTSNNVLATYSGLDPTSSMIDFPANSVGNFHDTADQTYYYSTGYTIKLLLSFTNTTVGNLINAVFISDNITIPPSYTSCGSPTSVNITQSNGIANISWSGASNGVENAISSYYIQYRTNSSGSWINLKSVASTATSGSTTTSIASINTGYYQVQVQTRGSAGSNYYSNYQTSSPLASATVVSAPTTISLSQLNGTLTISWSGASSGTSNTIVGYDIQYRTSASETYATLSSITSTATSGSITTSIISLTTGYYQVQIRTRGSQGTNYYSGYKASSSIATATNCTAPTTFTVIPSLTTGDLTLNWSGASSGISNNISSYYIQYRTSSDASNWDSWIGLATKIDTNTSSSYSYTTSISDGTYIQYQIRTQGSQGSNYYSGYTISSNYTRINTPPATISSVATSKSSYNQGDSLTLSWITPTDIDGNIIKYQIFYLIEGGVETYLTETTSLSYTLIPTQANNQQRVQYGVRAVDELGEYSPSIKYSDFITRDDATGLKIYADGEYKKAYIYVCQNGVYNMADIYVCSNGSYSQAID